MRAFFHRANQAFSGLCGWLMLAMMILLIIDVISRFIAKPIQGMAELSVFVMMIAIYLGLARCEENREHVALEFVVNYLSPAKRRVVARLARMIAVLTAGVFLYAVLLNAINSYQTRESLEGTVELAIWPVKWVMVVGLVFFLIQTLFHAFGEGRKDRSPRKGGSRGSSGPSAGDREPVF